MMRLRAFGNAAWKVADPAAFLRNVVGTEGRVEVSDPWHGTERALTVTMRGADPVRTEIEPGNPYQLELEEFGKAVRGEPNQLIGRADAEGQARAVEALYLAAASGTTVTIS